MWFWYRLPYWLKVSTNLGFGCIIHAGLYRDLHALSDLNQNSSFGHTYTKLAFNYVDALLSLLDLMARCQVLLINFLLRQLC